MGLKIKNIVDKGKLKTEAVLLYATSPVELGHYAIIDQTFDAEGNISNVYPHFYRFPAMTVKKGEAVVLWTKKGDYEVKKTPEGRTVHHFYWGSKAAIWNNTEKDVAVLLGIKTVDTCVTVAKKAAKK